MAGAWLLHLLLAAAMGAEPAAVGPRERFHILSARGWTLSIEWDMLGPLERLLKEEPDRLKIVGIDYELLYYSGGRYLLELPKGTTRESLPAATEAGERREAVPVLDGTRSVLIAEPSTGFPWLEKLLVYARDRSDESFEPGAETRSAHVTELGPLRALDVGPPGADGRWQATFASRYRLLVDGKPVTVTLLGKPLGGFSRVIPALQARARALQEPAVLVNLGDFGLQQEFGVAQDRLLSLMLDAGLDLVAFGNGDVEYAWEALLKAEREGRAVLLASNLKARGGGGNVRASYVRTVGRAKVGFLSFLDPKTGAIFERKKLPWSVESPIKAARERVRELRAVDKVDLVVAVSHLRPQDEAVLYDVPGIDLVVGGATDDIASRRRTVVELADWSREPHREPALKSNPSYFTYGDVAVELRATSEGYEPTRLEDIPGPVGSALAAEASLAAAEETVFGYFNAGKEPVLPDPRALWPRTTKPKMTYEPAEFWNLAAQLARRRAGAEVALLRVRPLGSNIPGEISESFVSGWLDRREPLMLLRLPGSALRALAPRLLKATPPVLDRDDNRKLVDEVWLAQAGLDAKGLVHGIPVRDEEYYSVVATEDLLKEDDAPAALQAAQDARPMGLTLDRAVMPWLKERRAGASSGAARASYEAEIRSMAEAATPERPLWRLDLRELSAQFANTQLHNEDPFGQVRDARIQSVNQIQGQGAAKLFSELYWRRWRWDAGASAQYGEVIIKPRGVPQIENKTQDQFLAETELRHRTWRLERGGAGYSLGPYVNASYDTEFTPNVGVPIRRLFWLRPGLKLFEGTWLRELHVAEVTQTDYSVPRTKTEYGFEAGYDWLSPIPGSNVTFQSKAVFIQFAPNRLDTLADLRRQLDASARLNVPVFGNLRLSPFVSFYLFDSKLLPERGYHCLFGVSIQYSQLWKPVF